MAGEREDRRICLVRSRPSREALELRDRGHQLAPVRPLTAGGGAGAARRLRLKAARILRRCIRETHQLRGGPRWRGRLDRHRTGIGRPGCRPSCAQNSCGPRSCGARRPAATRRPPPPVEQLKLAERAALQQSWRRGSRGRAPVEEDREKLLTHAMKTRSSAASTRRFMNCNAARPHAAGKPFRSQKWWTWRSPSQD